MPRLTRYDKDNERWVTKGGQAGPAIEKLAKYENINEDPVMLFTEVGQLRKDGHKWFKFATRMAKI